MTTYYHYYDTPIGTLLLAGSGAALTLLGFPSGSMARRHEPGWKQDAAPFREVTEQLGQYFAGERQTFTLSLAPAGTEFQQQVWATLQDIPFGDTWSYGQLAAHIGRPKASRAVGAANGLNPIPVIIPCHRVIGASGKLTGFGGGLDTKRYLLDLEAGAPGLELA
jgi:methylated-DNA-[protein]-cysteine S-methyltransferase